MKVQNPKLWWLVAFALLLGFATGASAWDASYTSVWYVNAAGTQGVDVINDWTCSNTAATAPTWNSGDSPTGNDTVTFVAGATSNCNTTLALSSFVTASEGAVTVLVNRSTTMQDGTTPAILGDRGGYLRLRPINQTHVQAVIAVPADKTLTCKDELPLNEWTTISLTWDSSNLYCYINGAYSGHVAAGSLAVITHIFGLGQNPPAAASSAGIKIGNWTTSNVNRSAAFILAEATAMGGVYVYYNTSAVTSTHPTNTTHNNASVPYSFQYQNTIVNSTGSPTGEGTNESCGYWLNGVETWLGNQTNGTAITGTLSAPLGHNNFTAFCGNAIGGNTTNTTWFTYSNTYSFRANDANTLAQINSFAITFHNTTNTTTYNTNTGWLNLSSTGLPTGANVTLEVMATGYRTTNYTRDVNYTAVIYENYPLSFSGVNITVYDESNANPIYSTISIYNSTNTLTWGNVLNITQALNTTLPTGAVTIDVSTANTSYYARRYYGTINNNSFYELKAYLLNATDNAIYVRFHIRDLISQPIVNATVQILRAIGGGAGVVVGEMVTDSSGDAAFYMELGSPYSIQIVATGYLPYYSNLNPSSNDYTITLTTTTGGGAGGLPTFIYEDINWWIIPSTALYAEITNLTLTIYSSNSSLDYFGAAFYNSTGYQLYFVNATGSPNGGVIYYNHNSTNNTGNITMQFWLRRNPGFEGNHTWPWLGGFFNNTAYSLNYTLSEMKDSGASSIGLGIVWLIITIIMGAFVCRVNLFGGVIVTIATLAVGSYAGWMVFPAIGGGSSIAAMGLIAAIAFVVVGWLYLRERV